MLDPQVAIQVYRGDLGMEGGRAQSVFAIDNDQVTLGLLTSQGKTNLTKGESMTLDDGTKITFTGAQPWVSLQTSYDPAQGWALISAIFLVAGLLTSLTIRRRRVWYRIRSAESASGEDDVGRTLIDIGGLARTDQSGYGAEFGSLVALATVPGPSLQARPDADTGRG
jgi:cytochrome c biogenesis protein